MLILMCYRRRQEKNAKLYLKKEKITWNWLIKQNKKNPELDERLVHRGL